MPLAVLPPLSTWEISSRIALEGKGIISKLEPTPLRLTPRTSDPAPSMLLFPSERSTANIAWSCIITVLISTWFAIHQNVPGFKDSGWTRLKRSATLIFYGAVAPDFLMMWAMNQLHGAVAIAKKYNTEVLKCEVEPSQLVWKMLAGTIRRWIGCEPQAPSNGPPLWTVTHGFYAQMGGFSLYKDGRPEQTLTFEHLLDMISRGDIEPPTLSDADLHHTGSPNSILNLLAILQIFWFLPQILLRLSRRLPVTALEVVTFATVILNLTTYILWWNKPRNVTTPIPIIPKVDRPLTVTSTRSKKRWIRGALEREFRRHAAQGWIGYLQLCWIVPLHLFIGLPLRPIYKMIMFPPYDDFSSGSDRVPMFYARYPSLGLQTPTMYSSLIIGALFGALHFLAWLSPFPSHVVRLVWLVATSIFTSTYSLTALALGLGTWNDYRWRKKCPSLQQQPTRMPYTMGIVSMLLMLCLPPIMPFFFLARLAVPILSFVSLCGLPEQIFTTTSSWTLFIPHLTIG